MRQDVVLREAQFDPKVKTYWLLGGIIILTVCVITIPLVPVWFLVGQALTGRYLGSLSCVLTERTLKLKKGVFVKIEKTVPLEKITDLGQSQGPIMRALGLNAMSVETAGQSSAGALVQMVGIVDVDGFRDAVLDQRDRLMAKESQQAAPAQDEVLVEVRDALLRIEAMIATRVS
ncbi:MAG: PH domain-containing protein [Planctomycetota bacterium]